MKFNLTLIFIVLGSLLHANTSARTKYAVQQPINERRFNQKFKESYSGRKYNYDGIAKSRPASQQHQNADYSEEQPYVVEDEADGFNFNFNVYNWLLIGILIMAVGYLIYTLLNNGSSRLFSTKTNSKLIHPTEFSVENIAHTDIKALIESAENTNDYRLAVRYYYMLVLKHLTLKNFITYAEDKTNEDYLYAMASQKFSKDFAYTSYIYNYTWYGEFALNAEQYQVAKQQFVQLIKKVNS
ncbi:hypothetical protein ES711_01290 [Gelidibacter salicanalis]|uniref:DUF4129 domain-containing protein n=1 Tax=Gelidibacter salicanalis TaxID=291193 RepID=A0A5C7APQ1_9FLAO|nr:hypothetical protein [Gelidibacter salicanalis]TXE10568.1 hypothetical protein ES711_01290 [Gelidibacter salicanalis]